VLEAISSVAKVGLLGCTHGVKLVHNQSHGACQGVHLGLEELEQGGVGLRLLGGVEI